MTQEEIDKKIDGLVSDLVTNDYLHFDKIPDPAHYERRLSVRLHGISHGHDVSKEFAELRARFEQIILDRVADQALDYVRAIAPPFGPYERETGKCNRCGGSGTFGERGGICFRCGGDGLPPAISATQKIARDRARVARLAKASSLKNQP